MGVKGLWRLLLPIGRRISIETLEGKILAIDASIWLTQFLKALRDPDTGQVQASAHILGFFRRICRLRFHGIRPVFVFDGATPEIKKRETALRRRRREQFATLSNTETVQRLAKRLLAQQLQKQKQLKTSPSAFAAGFNPGEQEPLAQEEKKTEAQPENETLKDNEPIEEDSKQQQQVNDWEVTVGVAAASDSEPDDNFDDTDDEDPPHNDFDITQLASLPSDKRKEAIETAKRQQRLRSRKEFLPAAADMHAFSQVQLSNFLRSTRLNQSIVQMATQAVEHDNEGKLGEVMVSDRTTRISLEREKDDEYEDQEPPGRKSPRKRGRIQRKDSASSEEDVNWDYEPPEHASDHDPDTRVDQAPVPPAAGLPAAGPSAETALADQPGVEVAPPVVKKPGRQIIASDDDDDDDDESESETLLAQSRRKASRGPKEVIAIDDSSDDDSELGGGFLRPDEQDGKKPAKQEVIQMDGDGSLDEERGGFTPAHAVAEASISNIPFAQERKSASLTDGDEVQVVEAMVSTKDHAYAQELEDRLLAQALQEEEDAQDARNLSTTDSATGSHENGAAEKSRGVQLKPAPLVATGTSVATKKVTENELKKAPSTVTTNVLEQADESASSSEEDVDWEDGDGSVGGDPQQAPTVTAGTTKSPYFNTEEEDIFASKIEKGLPAATASDTYSAETAAVLERAEAAASNLANWAGRAFRRAMKEVNGPTDHAASKESVESPVKNAAQPLANNQRHQSDEDFTDDEDVVVADARKVPPSSSKMTSSPTKASEVHHTERSNAAAGSQVAASDHDGGSASLADYNFEQFEEQWKAERNQRERDMDTVTDDMKEDCQKLLQLFGVPYIEAPAEAEAQCAALEALGLVDGVVTEDSDVFVFGGRTVYKNIFDDQKYAEVYSATDAEREMSLGRNEMVALAMLLGGDYTEGVKGVGIVNAMEVLQAFDVSNNLKEGLEKFRKWLDGFDPADAVAQKAQDASTLTQEQLFHAKHRLARSRWITPANFPANNVIQAYSNPVVDKSTDRFSWGTPDVDNLVVFCNRFLGWRAEETKQYLDPVMKKIQNGSLQTRMDSYIMRYEDGIRFADVRSKRLRDVLGLEQPKGETGTESESGPRKKKKDSE